jgi:hypothetical protein
MKERWRAKKPEAEKGPSKVEQLLGRGSPRVTFALGAVLSLPGVAYLPGSRTSWAARGRHELRASRREDFDDPRLEWRRLFSELLGTLQEGLTVGGRAR